MKNTVWGAQDIINLVISLGLILVALVHAIAGIVIFMTTRQVMDSTIMVAIIGGLTGFLGGRIVHNILAPSQIPGTVTTSATVSTATTPVEGG